MLDRMSFRNILCEQLAGRDACVAVEMHLYGGQSFFLRCVKEVQAAYALCDVVPVHEWSGDGTAPRHLVAQEAVVPYATIAELVVSARTVTRDDPLSFQDMGVLDLSAPPLVRR